MNTKHIFALAGVLLLAACSQKPTPTGADFQQIPADMIMVGMTQNMTSNGLRRARLMGDTAYVFDDSSKVKVKGVNLTIYNEQGEESAHLTSRAGDFNTQNQGMIARGHVILITTGATARRIETEELHYDPDTHKIWSNVSTLMVEGGSRITGDGFTADDKFENVSVSHPQGRVSGQRIRF